MKVTIELLKYVTVGHQVLASPRLNYTEGRLKLSNTSSLELFNSAPDD
jgi:hypothetical protein